MKTALQEAIAAIKEYRDGGNADVDTCNAILFKLASMLEKEKAQIMDAYTAGESDGDHYEDSHLRYYNETFDQ